MPGQESEAYEIDAFARQKLGEEGFFETGKADDGTVFTIAGREDLRVVMTSGSREGSILDYGRCHLQKKAGENWQTIQQVSKSDLAYGRDSLRVPKAIPAPVIGYAGPHFG